MIYSELCEAHNIQHSIEFLSQQKTPRINVDKKEIFLLLTSLTIITILTPL